MGDCSTLANYLEVCIRHAEVELEADFEKKRVKGKVEYEFECLGRGVERLVLDCKKVEVFSVEPFEIWEYGRENHVLGEGLIIEIGRELGEGEVVKVSIEFSTTEFCTAVQFLSETETFGKRHPFCYTECEAIHCRTLMPVQDTPSIKFTLNYKIKTKNPLKAVAGGIFTGEESYENESSVFCFQQKVPVPAYLVAFAVGDIDERIVSPRVKVFAEPDIIEAAAFEFEYTENELSAAEGVIGDYEWTELNILLLPPSFPYGGMENPNLIYVTPALLAGDRSLTNVIAHEIAHSWTGNLVTNASWGHFWLNEGFTVFLERKILEVLYGIELTSLFRKNGLNNLESAISVFGNTSNLTKLNPILTGIDPDDAFSSIPYEKGQIFLLFLESLVGKEAFNEFLREYIQNFKGKSINSSDFQEFFTENFPNLEGVDWEIWLRDPGFPPWIPEIEVSLLNEVNLLYTEWANPDFSPSPENIQNWPTEQTLALLNRFLEIPKESYLQCSTIYSFSSTKNAEIKFKWLMLVVALKAVDFFEEVKTFLQGIGRMKYVRPLFRSLVQEGQKEFAKEILDSCLEFYHPTLVTLLKKELGF